MFFNGELNCKNSVKKTNNLKKITVFLKTLADEFYILYNCIAIKK